MCAHTHARRGGGRINAVVLALNAVWRDGAEQGNGARGGVRHGRAVQVDPIKPTFTALGTKILRLEL